MEGKKVLSVIEFLCEFNLACVLGCPRSGHGSVVGVWEQAWQRSLNFWFWVGGVGYHGEQFQLQRLTFVLYLEMYRVPLVI